MPLACMIASFLCETQSKWEVVAIFTRRFEPLGRPLSKMTMLEIGDMLPEIRGKAEAMPAVLTSLCVAALL